jgi:DNA-binding CsgD family transcriptional regulator
VEFYDLVARDDELRRLNQTLGRAAGGRGVVVTATGPVGCGKTELLDAAASKEEFITLRAVCSAEERALPYAVIGQLLDHPVLSARAPDLACVTAPGRTLPADVENRLRRDLTRALLALASERPVLICIDDVHQADTASLDCLLHLARRVASARIAMILTELRRLTPAHSRFEAELLSLRHHHEIALRPLGPADTAELARGGLGPGVTADEMAQVYEATSGNPNLVRGLVNDVREAWAAGGTGIAAGRAYRLAYLSSLYRCGPVPLQIAQAAAVLGSSATVTLVRRVSGLDAETVDEATAILTEGGLLRDHRFPHPAARSVVLDDMSAQERRRLHRSALDVLDGVPVDVLAHHQAGAGLLHGPQAAEMFARASQELRVRGELDAATEYLQLAYRASDDAGVRAALQVETVAGERRRNPLAASRHLDELAAAARAGLLSAEHAALVVHWLADAGRPGEAAGALALQRGLAVTDHERARLRAAEVSLALFYPGVPGSDPRPLAPEELASLSQSARHGVTADNAVLAALRGRPESAVAEAENVLRNADTAASGPTALAALTALLYAENTDAAQLWADKLAAGIGAAEGEAGYAGPRTVAALRRGDLTTAVQAASAVLDRGRPSSLGITAVLPLSGAVAAAIRLGELERAEKWLAEPLPEAVHDSLFGLHLLMARGRYSLAVGRHEAAYTAFRDCGERMRRWDVDVPGLALWRVDAAEALLPGPDRAECRRLIDEQLTRPMGPRSRALTLRVRAAYAPPAKRIDLLDEAADLLLSSNDQYERARVLADLSEAFSALRQNGRARGILRQARHLAAQCGAVPLLRRLGVKAGRSGRLGRPPQGIRSLTEAERRVATLAAAGQTNREIADQLFVTASTVEQHLTNVFRKLGVKGRLQLPAELANVPPPG